MFDFTGLKMENENWALFDNRTLLKMYIGMLFIQFVIEYCSLFAVALNYL